MKNSEFFSTISYFYKNCMSSVKPNPNKVQIVSLFLNSSVVIYRNVVCDIEHVSVYIVYTSGAI